MFHIPIMAVDANRLEYWHAHAGYVAGDPIVVPRRRPIGQLVKSLISSRTRDAVSLAAYRDLRTRFGSAAGIAAAAPPAVEETIAAVTFADVKAARLIDTLRRIGATHGGYTLDHLGGMPIADALGELESLPGVGRKTAASVLNFSTLRRPVLVVDTHIARVLNRLGVAGDARKLSEIVTAALPHWPADTFVSFHERLKRLGQVVCRWDVPDCRRCPLVSACDTAARTRRRDEDRRRPACHADPR